MDEKDFGKMHLSLPKPLIFHNGFWLIILCGAGNGKAFEMKDMFGLQAMVDFQPGLCLIQDTWLYLIL